MADRPRPATPAAKSVFGDAGRAALHGSSVSAGGRCPELGFTAASRQRLVRQLLEAETTRRETRAAPGADAAQRTTTDSDRHLGADMASTDRPTLSVAETADLLGISRWLVQQAVHDGSLPSVRVGRRILIPRARLLAWLDGPPAEAASAPALDVLTRRRTPHAS